MELSSIAVMESHDDFILGYSLTLLTILKSKFFFVLRCLLSAYLIHHRILLASIRSKGACGCPRCLIPLSRTQNLGMTLDMKQRHTLARVDDENRKRKVELARDIIYNKNFAVNNKNVEVLLKPQSLVPTAVSPGVSLLLEAYTIFQNAFSKNLSRFGFNLFRMLLVDLMHEFELGIWKALFIHLLRILNAMDKALILELDRRYVHKF
jgi:hypothetical protein